MTATNSDESGEPPRDGGGGQSTPSRTGASHRETWIYESLVDALPWLKLTDRVAVALQFALFEAGVIAGWLVYDLPDRALWAGTATVAVAAGGSVAMLRIGERVRTIASATDAAATHRAYRDWLFDSAIEVALAVVAYVGLVTYLFVIDPRLGTDTPLLRWLFGDPIPVPVVAHALLVAWDLCYRIGIGWLASVAALRRSLNGPFPPLIGEAYRRIDRTTLGFAWLQLLLVPVVIAHPLLLAAVVGHVAAVTGVAGTAMWLLERS